MNNRKKISNGSEPTQPESFRRFARRNSIHTLHCRQGSLKKFEHCSEEIFASTPNLQTYEPIQNPQKSIQLSHNNENIFKDFHEPFTPPLKRGSGSMKIDPSHHIHREQVAPSQKNQALRLELQSKSKQVEHLTLQCNRYKLYLNEQTQKRKNLEEQIRCNKQEIKRLQKRVDRHKKEKEKYEQQRQMIIKHIEQLELAKFDQKIREIQGYQVKIMSDEVGKLRTELEKSRGEREMELNEQLEQYRESKFALEQQIKSANIANTVLSKQLHQLEEQMQIVQSSIHKTVTESYEYQQLREKYRIMLLQFKELREEMSIIERGNRSDSLMEGTLLTVSADQLSTD